MIDLVFFDDLELLQEKAKELGITTYIIAKKFSSANELFEFNKLIALSDFDFRSCAVLDEVDYRKLAAFKDKADFIAVSGGTIELNKFAVQRKEIDLLLNPVTDSFPAVDAAIARESKEKNTPFCFNASYFNSLSKLKKAYYFKNALTAVKLINKFKGNALFFSCARNEKELINPKKFAEEFLEVGFSEKQINFYLNEFPYSFFKIPRIPSFREALELLKEFSVPENVVKHSKQVNNVALFIGKKLKEKGFKVNMHLLGASALLHDVAKHSTPQSKEKRHSIEGAELIESKGFPLIGKIIAEHGTDEILKPKPFCCIESKILFYADKRVKSDKIVSLKERFDYLFEKYGSISNEVHETLEECYPKIMKLEEDLIKRNKIDLKELKN
ncbi:MAG: HDIG domain-containing protein [Candidatus Diapherotrites archaeon]|nr:HDIG domain-containing protein [Candidatus Diapherotrites archaeon]